MHLQQYTADSFAGINTNLFSETLLDTELDMRYTQLNKKMREYPAG